MNTKTGLKIKRLREYRNYTQDYMSDKLGISQNTYSKIESGGVKLTTDRLKEISKILEVPVETILSDDTTTFNVTNSHIEKFYIETLQEENKELYKMLQQQITYLQNENERLLKVIENMGGKKK